MTTVYQPTTKAVQSGKFDPRDRVVFYQGGRAMLYREATLRDPRFNSNVAKEFFKKTKERAPMQLNAFGKQAREVARNELPLPCAVFQF